MLREALVKAAAAAIAGGPLPAGVLLVVATRDTARSVGLLLAALMFLGLIPAMRHPERIEALVVQNANAYLDGLTPPRQAFFRSAAEDRSAAKVRELARWVSDDAIRETQYLRDARPPLLVLWGERDPAFIAAGARAYLCDAPHAELHLLDAGHFAAEERPVEVAQHMLSFLSRHAHRTDSP